MEPQSKEFAAGAIFSSLTAQHTVRFLEVASAAAHPLVQSFCEATSIALLLSKSIDQGYLPFKKASKNAKYPNSLPTISKIF